MKMIKMLKKLKVLHLLLTIHFAFFTSFCFSQGVAINTTGTAADASAAFEVSSSTGGTLITRMTTAERNAILNPAEGLQIYNTTIKCLEIYISPKWQNIYCGCTPPASPITGVHNYQQTEITWNWNSVSGATGYRYNTVNDYSSATNNGTNTTYTQTGLTCNTSYTLYVWAYNNCDTSTMLFLTENTTACFTCNNNFTDSRDAQSYQTVQIGSQCWMKQNLNYNAPNSYCYNNDISNCNIYGRLYTWDATMAGSASSSNNPSGVQGVCPTGWHLPSDVEWKQLEMYLGMLQAQADATGWRGTNEGGKLKETATAHWNSPNNGATNSSNFTSLPGGARDWGGQYLQLGSDSYCWSTTEYGSNVWERRLGSDYSQIFRNADNKGSGYSVRCVKD